MAGVKKYKHQNYVKTVYVSRGYKLTIGQQFRGVYNQLKPRNVNTNKNYKSHLDDIQKILVKEFHIKKLKNLRTVHFDKIVEIWKGRKYKSGSLANRMSTLRSFAWATGKVSCVRTNKEYEIQRGRQSFGEKRWTQDGAGDRDIIKRVDGTVHKWGDRMRHVLYLQRVFGLRMREALMFTNEQIILDRDGKPVRLEVVRGAKNARRREIPVVTNEQRNYLKYLIQTYSSNAIQPKGMNYKKWANIYFYVLKKIGVGGEKTGHGLRQGYANDRLKSLIIKIKNDYYKSGKFIPESEIKKIAYRILTEELGHSRVEILKNYLEDY